MMLGRYLDILNLSCKKLLKLGRILMYYLIMSVYLEWGEGVCLMIKLS